MLDTCSMSAGVRRHVPMPEVDLVERARRACLEEPAHLVIEAEAVRLVDHGDRDVRGLDRRDDRGGRGCPEGVAQEQRCDILAHVDRDGPDADLLCGADERLALAASGAVDEDRERLVRAQLDEVAHQHACIGLEKEVHNG